MPKKSIKRLPMLLRTAITVGITLLLGCAACGALAMLALSADDPTAHLSLYGRCVFGLCMLFCGFLGAAFAEERRFASGIVASVCLLVPEAILFFVFGGEVGSTLLLLAGGGAALGILGALLGARERRRKRSRR